MDLRLIGAVVMLLVITGFSWLSYDYGYKRAKVQQIQSYQDQVKQLEQKITAGLERERLAHDKQEQISATYLEQQKEIRTNAAHTISEYRAHTISLRDSLKSKQCPANLSNATDSASSNHAETTGGLLDTDVEFLIQEARRADEVTKQLDAAQQLIEQDRAVCNGRV